MRVKTALVAILLVLCAAAAPAQRYRIKYSYDDKDPISLENAIRLALENNYELLLTEQDVVIAEQRLKEAKLLYLPQVSLNAGATAYNLDSPTVLPDSLGLRFITPSPGHQKEDLFYGVGLLATQNIYTGGRTSSTVSLANAALKEAMSRYEAVKSSVIFGTKQAFLEYLFLQHKESVAREAALGAREAISKGKSGRWERVLIAAGMAGLESEVSKVEEALNAAHIKLLSALNKELNGKVFISGGFNFNPVDVDLAKITLWAMEFRPELKSALYKLEMDNIAVKLSLAKRYPDIILGFGYDRLGENNINDENVHMTLALKLPIGYDYSTQLKQKKAEQRQTVLRRAAIEDAIRLQVRTAYNNLMYWQQETAARRDAWDGLKKELDAVAGSGLGSADIVRIFEYYYKTGAGYLEGIKQHMLAVAELELATGRDIRD
ncbi:MAG: TolC family protein [Elusimicrobiota bacterium]|jgi:outer membrane protein TolC|nr:TolC family protein [Elusimicrobiota bacterium]